MKKRRPRTLTAVIGSAVLILAVTAVGSHPARAQGINLGDLNLISVEDETRMGKEMSVDVEREHPLLNDGQVQRYVRDLGGRLARYVPNTGIPLTVKVVRDDEVNAFTIPGGYIYVNSGLIKRLDTEAELAGVIAHEMSHAVNRDGTKQLTRMYGISFFLNLVLGSNAPQWQQIAGDLFSTVGLLAYGRTAETEADKGAVRISRAAGYNPTGYLDFLKKLQAMEQSQPNLLTELFSTHPETSGRIGTVEREIALLPPPAKRLINNSAQFDRIRRRIH
jgi:beta-barrel assembly-enhancing protease